MAETPDQVYERILAEEQAKGSSPPVAEGRAKAARFRARKAEGGETPAAPAPPAPPAVDAATPAPRGDPATGAVAQAPRTDTGPTHVPQDVSGAGESPGQSAPVAPLVPQTKTVAAPVAVATKPAAGNGNLTPERIQRLLAVVKPEAIQRVEKEPMDRVNVWPHLMASEFLAILAVTAFLVLFSTFVDATFRELANINVTPNPSKAPWYFLGLQELLRYFHPQIAGVTIPQWIILGLMAAPYIDRNPSTKPNDRKLAIVLFTFFLLFNAILVILGSIFRGPGFNFVYPWDAGIFFEL